MRTNSILLFSIIVLAHVTFCGCLAAAEFIEKDKAPRLIVSNGPLFSWVHRGSVIFRSFGHLKCGEYLYRYKNGDLVVVEGNISECSAALREELDDRQRADEFVRTTLANVLLSFMGGCNTYIVNQHYAETRESLPGFGSMLEKSPQKLDASRKIWRKHQSSELPVVENSEWKLDFKTTFENGSIERWIAKGIVFPFAITEFKRIILEKKGTVVPLIAPG